MEKILGIDLGTNSIGWAIRNPQISENQIENYGVIVYKKGIGEEKGVEYSFAAERTKNRSLRRRYQAHKYKLWATLEILIRHKFCPLTIDELNEWRKYKKGIGRKYPVNNNEFNNWIKLDFNNDCKPDYISPYQLRLELVQNKLDINQEINKYKIGRAIYHIAQHRGFKSSKKILENEESGNESDLVGAEKKRAEFIENLLVKHQVKTVGAALAKEESNGVRIRSNLFQYVLRKQLQNEVKEIFNCQSISFNEMFNKEISKSTIFWQRPLRSQKGTIGKCTLEPNKFRCPVSHPFFEAFRAWSFLNTIEYKLINGNENKWNKIPLELRNLLFKEKFMRSKDFDFIDLKNFIHKTNQHKNWEFNYKDNTNVSACPVSASLRDIFGENWEAYTKKHLPFEKRKSNKNYYDIFDIWHVLFSFEDEDDIRSFIVNKLELPDKVEKFVALWYKMPIAYGMLSLKAINNILPFLKEGLIYTEAVILAKIPSILGDEMWLSNESKIKKDIKNIIEQNRDAKKKIVIVNSLIAKYKSLDNQYKFAERDYDYQLKEDDKKNVVIECNEFYGKESFNLLPNKNDIIIFVQNQYQSFFYDKKREFKKQPHLLDSLKTILSDTFILSEKQLNKLYHPSQITIYPPAKETFYETHNKHMTLLGSPATGAFKNPMAMRTLFELKKLVNHLIITDQIDENTKVVVEVARELNDANMRAAIEKYQRFRQEENKEFANAIVELLNEIPSLKADPNNDEDIDKFRLWFEQLKEGEPSEGFSNDWLNNKSKVYKEINSAKEMIEKYRLWKEQECQCIYTGRFIGITDLFSENNTDFEHTIPRSMSFDNSFANLTICDFVYNRTIKKNNIPTALLNYDDDVIISDKKYSAIKPRLYKWEKKVENIKKNIEFWNKKSKSASTKEFKDKAIQQRHLWRFELDYWQNKLNRFTLKEVKSGFKNSQLIDTQIISKYAYHYLKSVFYTVRVQKGAITAEFRKIYGIQPKNQKKNRDFHSHHAKDAAILTLIPTDAKRDEILKEAFLFHEKSRKQYTIKPYNGFKNYFIENIDQTILINNSIKDNALTPGRKRVRIRGKKIFLRTNLGELKKDDLGNDIEKWAKGDSIRGKLHLESFYGKIKLVKRDEHLKPIKNKAGEWEYEDKNEGFAFVIRKEVNKELKVDTIVDLFIKQMFIKQMNGRNIEKTIKEDGGIWMINKCGEKLHKIRHIRCFANDVAEPLAIKKQTYESSKDYKNNFWAKNGENYAYILYQGVVNNKIERKFKLLNLFDAAKIYQLNNYNELSVELEIDTNKKGNKLPLHFILKTGLKVLFYKENNPEELFDLENTDLSKRLYKILKFEKDGRIVFGYHLDARSDNDLKALSDIHGKSIYNGFSNIDFENPMPKLKLSPGNFNFLIENKDFFMKPDGKIYFNNKG
jgi:CRISPR-associated endonuclease Csn1